MPSLGSGLSLGTLNKIPGFDFDASSYIVANNISNSQEIRNYSSGKSLLLPSGGNSDICFSTNNQASLGASSPFATLATKTWTIGFWVSPQQFVASSNIQVTTELLNGILLCLLQPSTYSNLVSGYQLLIVGQELIPGVFLLVTQVQLVV